FMRVRRGMLLEQLLARRLGELELERPRNAPQYDDIPEKELTETSVWNWYMRPEVQRLVDWDRKRLGMAHLGMGAWVTIALNDWIGHPGGLPIKPLRPTKRS